MGEIVTLSIVRDRVKAQRAAPLAAEYIRREIPVEVKLDVPLADGSIRELSGWLTGEMHARGRLHHYRVRASDGILYQAPPSWVRGIPGARRRATPKALEADVFVAAVAKMLVAEAERRSDADSADGAGDPE